MDKKWIDPRLIKSEDIPVMVFSSHSWNIISYLIKWRTKRANNHVMWMINKHEFASQGGTYARVPVKKYLKSGNRLKFVKIRSLEPVYLELILGSIYKKLGKPWYRKLYDGVGVFGQAIGIKKLNIPWLDFCSEDAPSHLKVIKMFVDKNMQKIVDEINDHKNPGELNEIVNKHPAYFEVLGYWWND